MTILFFDHDVPMARILCDCGEEFEVEPYNEENLVWNGRELVDKCPTCGRINPNKSVVDIL